MNRQQYDPGPHRYSLRVMNPIDNFQTKRQLVQPKWQKMWTNSFLLIWRLHYDWMGNAKLFKFILTNFAGKTALLSKSLFINARSPPKILYRHLRHVRSVSNNITRYQITAETLLHTNQCLSCFCFSQHLAVHHFRLYIISNTNRTYNVISVGVAFNLPAHIKPSNKYDVISAWPVRLSII